MLLVKICGTRTPESAKAAIEAGADLIGMICVPNVKRTVEPGQAKAISCVVHSFQSDRPAQTSEILDQTYDVWTQSQLEAVRLYRPLLVGVFRDQSLDQVLALTAEYELDMVQLHGSEPITWARQIPVPVIKKFSPADVAEMTTPGFHALTLLDGAGGEGLKLDWDALPRSGKYILAGGLDPENVAAAVASGPNIVGVDVSSGVETDGVHDLDKIRTFVRNAKSTILL
ncbi:isomerase-domain-containing protein [Lipomyces arxii]|uniref:isomerase-domain-containing protein n=1 Tax=Lipomyces arxii TaxID=56418 RepID=UPI0034D01F46